MGIISMVPVISLVSDAKVEHDRFIVFANLTRLRSNKRGQTPDLENIMYDLLAIGLLGGSWFLIWSVS